MTNDEMKTLVVVECKSDFTFEWEERLRKQIDFYSCKECKAIYEEMFPNLSRLEIWIVTYEKMGTKALDCLKRGNLGPNSENVVVWEASIDLQKEEVCLRKTYGEHLDSKLNNQMEEQGLKTSKPRSELLIDPTLSIGEKVFRIGRRILAFMASSYISEADRIITIRDFRDHHPDTTVMTDVELKRCLRYLMLLVPEIGDYNSGSGEILLSKKPRLDKVKKRLESLQEMDEEQIKVELVKSGGRGQQTSIKRPTKTQKTKLDTWLKTSQSCIGPCNVFIQERHLDAENDLMRFLEHLQRENELGVDSPAKLCQIL